jgi:HSP20 family protein
MALRNMTPFVWFRNNDGRSTNPAPASQPGAGVGSLADLHNQINTLFDQAFSGSGFPDLFADDSGQTLFKPNLDIREGEKQYEVSLEMPGVSKDDVDVEVRGDALIIRGEKKREDSHEEGEYQYTERSYGSFQRVLSLPEDADSDSIEAGFENGILRVKLPRRELGGGERRKVEVK